MADTWFERRTHRGNHWSLDQLLAAKAETGQSVSVVLPARNEAATIGDIVGQLHAAFVSDVGLIDELVVIDGQSVDDTAALARAAGATVHALSQIRPDLGHRDGKGEAIWKSHFVTSGDLMVFIDADLTEWDVRFVTGLLGPLLTDSAIDLVKAFYERPFRGGGVDIPDGGGRVTELVARPLLALTFPELTQVVQPLAGEWAVRRSVHETLSVPVGYGVDVAALIDIAAASGIDAVAQVDLGRRAHSHHELHELAPMAGQVAGAVLARANLALPDEVVLRQFRPGPTAVELDLTLDERPPAGETVP